MLNIKDRTKIVLTVVGAVFFLPAACLILFSLLNILVAKDPRITDREYRAEYKASGRFQITAGCDSMIMKTRETGNGWEMHVQQCNTGTGLPLDTEGQMREQDAFTLFWIYIKNPVINSMQRATAGYEAKITDPMNWLGGGKGAKYTARIRKPFIFWSHIFQSQASYEMGIYDEAGLEAATATIDATCGLMFELTTHHNGAGRLSLVSTDFPISRNRYFLAAISTIAGAILAFIFIFRFIRSPEDAKARRLWEMKFVLWGILACYVDIYPDVWWPFAFGTIGLLGIHALALAPGAVWFRWWILPGVIEIIWASNFALQTESMVPQLTHSPGIILSWMMATLFFRIPRKKTGRGN